MSRRFCIQDSTSPIATGISPHSTVRRMIDSNESPSCTSAPLPDTPSRYLRLQMTRWSSRSNRANHWGTLSIASVIRAWLARARRDAAVTCPSMMARSVESDTATTARRSTSIPGGGALVVTLEIRYVEIIPMRWDPARANPIALAFSVTRQFPYEIFQAPTARTMMLSVTIPTTDSTKSSTSFWRSIGWWIASMLAKWVRFMQAPISIPPETSRIRLSAWLLIRYTAMAPAAPADRRERTASAESWAAETGGQNARLPM